MCRTDITRTRTFVLIALILIVFSVLLWDQAFASEGSGGGGHGEATETVSAGGTGGAGETGHGADRTGDLLDLLYRFINFALLVVILGWALKKADIKGLLSKRTEEIRETLEGLKRDKEEAERKCKEVEARLREFERERERIIQDYQREGHAERDRIIEEARRKVQKIMEQAEFTIRQEIQSARDRLREDVVDLAAQQAQEIISKRITEEDQVHLVNDFIERVGKIH
ncbi:MAG: F0F1 ATP synthase subunit B [Deltaproteobacteria bacterium]|nr:F0F1 ATP synthase subunit B [Deltaproteobacteria bacterium]MBW2135984.1 F0F1 ATP synthase subunit B [Deltaproteobacteria bacterium]